jgi:integrase
MVLPTCCLNLERGVPSCSGSDWHAVRRRRSGRARKGTGSIYERGGRFVAQIDFGVKAGGTRDRKSRTFETREEAEKWLVELRSSRRFSDQPVAQQRLAEYLRWWLEHEAPKGKPGGSPLSENTLDAYRTNIEKHLIPVLGERVVGELTPTELDAFAGAKARAGLSPGSINRIRGTLRSALATAVRQDRLHRNVAQLGGGVGESHRPVQRFTDEELRQLLDAARAHTRYWPLFVLLARTGLRLGEALGLAWRDVDLDGEHPSLRVVSQLDKRNRLVRPKSAHSIRTVGLRPEVVEALRHRRAEQAADRDRAGDEWANEFDLVFTTVTGRPVSKANISGSGRVFERVREHAGVQAVVERDIRRTVRTFRSTVGTQLAEAGVHPEEARQFLGHSSVSVTLRFYTGLRSDGRAAELLPPL